MNETERRSDIGIIGGPLWATEYHHERRSFHAEQLSVCLRRNTEAIRDGSPSGYEILLVGSQRECTDLSVHLMENWVPDE